MDAAAIMPAAKKISFFMAGFYSRDGSTRRRDARLNASASTERLRWGVCQIDRRAAGVRRIPVRFDRDDLDRQPTAIDADDDEMMRVLFRRPTGLDQMLDAHCIGRAGRDVG